MELTQQVKNYYALKEQTSRNKPVYKAQSEPEVVHFGALQHLSDGKYVPYEATLRVVTHEDNKSSKQPYTKTRKPPGYARNDLGGFFTS